jgi:hypothetical protein
MLDWKILVAAVAALLVASTVLVGGSGGLDFGLGDIFGRIGEWLKSSPFGGFFQSPIASTHEVNIILHPRIYTLKTSSNINVTIDPIDLIEFSGDIKADFQEKMLIFKESGTQLNIRMPLHNMTIINIGVDRIVLTETDFVVNSGDLDISGENSTIEITDFLGEIVIDMESVTLNGNVSMVRGNNKDIV